MKQSLSTLTAISLTLTVFSISISINCFSQQNESERGFYLNPGITYTPDAYRRPGKAPDFQTGLFGDYRLSRRLGIAGGLGYKLLNVNTLFFKLCPYTSNGPPYYVNAPYFCAGYRNEKYHFLEFPMQLSINLHPEETSRIRPYLVGGLTYGILLNVRQAREGYGHESIRGDAAFYSAGLEVKIMLSDNRSLTIGAHYDYTKMYYTIYKGIHNPKLVIKVGKIRKRSSEIESF